MASLVFVTKLDNSDSYYTDKSKKANARLRELAPAARGSQEPGSRNLAFAFFDMSVLLFRLLVSKSRKNREVTWCSFDLKISGRKGTALPYVHLSIMHLPRSIASQGGKCSTCSRPRPIIYQERARVD